MLAGLAADARPRSRPLLAGGPGVLGPAQPAEGRHQLRRRRVHARGGVPGALLTPGTGRRVRGRARVSWRGVPLGAERRRARATRDDAAYLAERLSRFYAKGLAARAAESAGNDGMGTAGGRRSRPASSPDPCCSRPNLIDGASTRATRRQRSRWPKPPAPSRRAVQRAAGGQPLRRVTMPPETESQAAARRFRPNHLSERHHGVRQDPDPHRQQLHADHRRRDHTGPRGLLGRVVRAVPRDRADASTRWPPNSTASSPSRKMNVDDNPLTPEPVRRAQHPDAAGVQGRQAGRPGGRRPRQGRAQEAGREALLAGRPRGDDVRLAPTSRRRRDVVTVIGLASRRLGPRAAAALQRPRQPQAARHRGARGRRPVDADDAGRELARSPGRRHGPRPDQRVACAGAAFGAEIVTGHVTAVDLSARPFRITLTEGEMLDARAHRRDRRVGRLLGLPSERALMGHGVTTCATCDGYFYRGRPVAVIGGGDSAARGGDLPHQVRVEGDADPPARQAPRVEDHAGQGAGAPEDRVRSGTPSSRRSATSPKGEVTGLDAAQRGHRRALAPRGRRGVRRDRPHAEHRPVQGPARHGRERLPRDPARAARRTCRACSPPATCRITSIARRSRPRARGAWPPSTRSGTSKAAQRTKARRRRGARVGPSLARWSAFSRRRA